MLVMGMDVKTTYFALTGLLSILFIILTYLFASISTGNHRLSLSAALLFTLSRSALTNSIYFNPRAIAAIFALLSLYMLIRGRNTPAMRVIAVFLIFPLVITHTTTLFYASVIMFLLFAIELFLFKRSRYIGYLYPISFTMAYLAYWTFVTFPLFSSVLQMVMSTADPISVPSESLRVTVSVALARNADYIILALFAIIGIAYQLYEGRKRVGMLQQFGLLSFLALPFNIAGPVSLFLPTLLATRLSDLWGEPEYSTFRRRRGRPER
jgi:hypothetical protein